jgi:hypothetical protein
MTRETENAHYDTHNRGARFSNDPALRLYGRCGCSTCAVYRAKYLADVVSPIDQRGTSMGSINICDRCPSMVKGKALGVVQIRTSSDPDTSEVSTRELCPACIEEIDMLLMTDVGERDKRAYDKPYTRQKDAPELDGMTAEQMAAALFEKLMKASGRELESGK